MPQRISALGVTLQADDRRGIVKALLLLLAFFTATFVVYAWVDFTKWVLAQRQARVSHQSEGRLADEAKAELQARIDDYAREDSERRNATARTQMIAQAEEWLFRELNRRSYVPIRRLSLVRVLLDFALPLVMAVLAFVAMIDWLDWLWL